MGDNWHYTLQLALLAAICGASWRIPDIDDRVIAACAVAVGCAAVALIAVVVLPDRPNGTSCMEHRIISWIPQLIVLVIVVVFFTIRLAWLYKYRKNALNVGRGILTTAGAWYSDRTRPRAGMENDDVHSGSGTDWDDAYDVDVPRGSVRASHTAKPRRKGTGAVRSITGTIRHKTRRDRAHHQDARERTRVYFQNRPIQDKYYETFGRYWRKCNKCQVMKAELDKLQKPRWDTHDPESERLARLYYGSDNAEIERKKQAYDSKCDECQKIHDELESLQKRLGKFQPTWDSKDSEFESVDD